MKIEAFWKRMFRRRSEVVDVETFGPRMTAREVEHVLHGAGNESVRAVLQLLCAHRQICQRAVEDKSNLLHGQTAFEAGAAAGLTDFMRLIQGLRDGRGITDGQVKSWFRTEEK